MLTRQENAAVAEFKSNITSALGDKIISIKLFGSKARGDETPESDIDLLVEVNERTGRVEDAVYDAAFEANLKYGVFISARIIPSKVLEDPVWSITPFLKNIRREGVLV